MLTPPRTTSASVRCIALQVGNMGVSPTESSPGTTSEAPPPRGHHDRVAARPSSSTSSRRPPSLRRRSPQAPSQQAARGLRCRRLAGPARRRTPCPRRPASRTAGKRAASLSVPWASISQAAAPLGNRGHPDLAWISLITATAAADELVPRLTRVGHDAVHYPSRPCYQVVTSDWPRSRSDAPERAQDPPAMASCHSLRGRDRSREAAQRWLRCRVSRSRAWQRG